MKGFNGSTYRDYNDTHYIYKGIHIYKVTKKDYCVFDDSGCVIDAMTLSEAKAEIDSRL